VEVSGSEFKTPVDVLIVAIGQRANLGVFGDHEVEVNAAGYLDVNPETLETSIPGVFAGGDIIGEGPATIVKAVGDGRRIASAILERERRPPHSNPRTKIDFSTVDLLKRRSRRQFRQSVSEIPAAERDGFCEVTQTLSRDRAVSEAARCLDCDLLCSTCESVCPNRAIVTYRTTDLPREIPLLIVRGSAVGIESTKRVPIDQEFQVAVLADLCNECGNCTTFCPTAGAPYRDKPRLFLDQGDFEAESDNAFTIDRHDDRWRIQGAFGGQLHEIVLSDRLKYSTEGLRVDLDPGTFGVLHTAVTRKTATRTVTLHECTTLWALLKGMQNSIPWLFAEHPAQRANVRT